MGVLGAIGGVVVGAAGGLLGGGSTNIKHAARPDLTPGLAATAAASVDKMAMFVGGQILNTQMMTSMMNMQGTRDMMLQQDKLDTKLEIASLNYQARMKKAEWGHRERMTELANEHIEALAQGDEIELDSENYKYPYQS